jgi:hypothetical protein
VAQIRPPPSRRARHAMSGRRAAPRAPSPRRQPTLHLSRIAPLPGHRNDPRARQTPPVVPSVPSPRHGATLRESFASSRSPRARPAPRRFPARVDDDVRGEMKTPRTRRERRAFGDRVSRARTGARFGRGMRMRMRPRASTVDGRRRAVIARGGGGRGGYVATHRARENLSRGSRERSSVAM